VTEVLSGDLEEGAGVIVGEEIGGGGAAAAAAPETTNPFAPKFPRRGRRGR
jgi:hypothetical protein